jgi:hypothetical protein
LLFPERTIEHEGVTLTVRGLPARKVLKLASLLQALGGHIGGSNPKPGCDCGAKGSLLMSIGKYLGSLLEESVEIRGADLRVLDLPVRMFRQVFQTFLDVNFHLGTHSCSGKATGNGSLLPGAHRHCDINSEVGRWCAILLRNGHRYSEVREYPLPAVHYLARNLLESGAVFETRSTLEDHSISEFIRTLNQ